MTTGEDPLPCQRGAFSIPEGVTYLNGAYQSPQLRAVTEAGLRAARRKEQPWAIQPADFFDDLERLRALFAELVGGDADGVAVVPAASYALSTAATNVQARPGDRIVVLAEQYPSNVYPWRDLAQRTGAEVVAVPHPAEGSWTQAVVGAIDERTAAVAVPNCHFMTGARLDLVAVGQAARAAGACFVVDVTQSLGVVPLDVRQVRPDVVVAAGYKWLLGPYSVAYSWTAPERRDWRPLEHHWAGRAGSEDFARLTDYTDAYRPGARRFDGGEASSFGLVPMALVALETVVGWTVPRVAAAVAPLGSAIRAGAVRAGLGLRAPDGVDHLIGLSLPEGVAGRVVERLAQEQVHVSLRGDALRVSAHVYTTAEDVDRLVSALGAAL